MKKIIICLMALLSMCNVIADLNVDESFYSEGDINSNIWYDAHGNVNVVLNNVPVDGTEDTYVYNTNVNTEMSDVYDGISNLFLDWDYRTKEYSYAIPNPNYKPAFRLWEVFNLYFVPRKEHDQIVNTLLDEITKNRLEIMALYELVEPTTNEVYNVDSICDAKLKVGKKLNLDAVVCGNITYYNHQGGSLYYGLS